VPRAKATNGGNNVLPTFISCQLTEAEFTKLAAGVLPDSEIVDFIVKVAEAEIKFSVGYDSFNDTFGCTLTTKGVDNKTPGRALHSRGPSVQEAVTVAAYKFYEKLGGDLGSGTLASKGSQWG